MLYAVIICACLLALLVVAFGLYLFCLAPNKRKNVVFPYNDVYIAHRGFFDNKTEMPENSLGAFRNAVNNGYGIELDVQLSKDNQLVVFHDESLTRMCKLNKNVRDLTYAELQTLTLADSQERIPLFTDVLQIVNGKVPLIVEIKSEGDYKTATLLTLEILQDYKGEFCIESFHPSVLEIVKKRNPQIVRGQLSTNYFKDEPKRKWLEKLLLTNLLLNFKSRPDFVAYNHKYANQRSYKFLRRFFGVINVAWTIKSQAELEKAKAVFSCIIFDSFIPDENK